MDQKHNSTVNQDILSTHNDDLSQQIDEANEQITVLKSQITQMEVKHHKEAKEHEKVVLELRKTNAALKSTTEKLLDQEKQFKQLNEKQSTIEEQLKTGKKSNDDFQKRIDILQVELADANDQLGQLKREKNNLAEDCGKYMATLKRKENENSRLQKDWEHERTQIDKINKRLSQSLYQISAMKSSHEDLESELSRLKVAERNHATEIQAKSRILDELTSERDRFRAKYKEAASDNQSHTDDMKFLSLTERSLEKRIQAYKQEIIKQREITVQMRQQRDHSIAAYGELQAQFIELISDIKNTENELEIQKKKVNELEVALGKMKQDRSLMGFDFISTKKSVIQYECEIDEIKRNSLFMQHRIDQLKTENHGKTVQLMEEKNERSKIIRERGRLQSTIVQLNRKSEKEQENYTTLQKKAEGFYDEISEVKKAYKKQTKQLEQMIAQRDILGSQLIRRNDELALLYEKLKTQQLILRKGENQYNVRVEDIRILKIELKNLCRKNAILQTMIANKNDIKREFFRIQGELAREHIRSRALEEELQNPMNVHRWRQLETTDPSKYELLIKIHTLQKGLIRKSEEVAKRDLIIRAKENLLDEFKRTLARPNVEVAEQLSAFQHALRAKTRQLKMLISEVNMYESEVDSCKYKISTLTKQLNDLSKKRLLLKQTQSTTRTIEDIPQIDQRPNLSIIVNGTTLQPPPSLNLSAIDQVA